MIEVLKVRSQGRLDLPEGILRGRLEGGVFLAAYAVLGRYLAIRH